MHLGVPDFPGASQDSGRPISPPRGSLSEIRCHTPYLFSFIFYSYYTEFAFSARPSFPGMPLTRSSHAARGIARPPGPARRRGPRQGGRGPGPEAPAAAGSAFTPDGWFRTGDVATIDPHGYVQITDRIKDLVKSKGEWISSVDRENALARIPTE